MKTGIFERIISLSRFPSVNSCDWLGNAAEGTDFLINNDAFDEIVLYACGPHMFIHSVLAPAAGLDPPNHADLYRGYALPSHSWTIEKIIEGGKDSSIHLTPPLSQSGCRSFEGGEKLIFFRSFEGFKGYNPPIEISQKLVHALDLHYVDDWEAYCRLDKRGDIEQVINVYRNPHLDSWEEVRAVTIRPRDLSTYMALTATSLVTSFSFTRFVPGEFNEWPAKCSDEFENRDIFCRHGATAQHGSYQKGHIIRRTKRTQADLVEEWKDEEDKSNRKYATFLIVDRKNGGKVIETSCSPDHIVNYFSKSNLPWEISPAFFRPDVLHKYKSDPEKYTMDNGIIECRGAWHLRSCHTNDAGQVQAYIGDLAELPYDEQLYWKSCNEHPKAGISERAYQTDILGQFPKTVGHLENLKNIVVELDKKPPAWWKPRGEVLISAVHGQATESILEWGNEILALDQLVVEGFQIQPLQALVKSKGGEIRGKWRSFKLIEVSLVLKGKTEDQAKDTVAPLQELHDVRNSVAHGDPRGQQLAVKAARKKSWLVEKPFHRNVGKLGRGSQRNHRHASQIAPMPDTTR